MKLLACLFLHQQCCYSCLILFVFVRSCSAFTAVATTRTTRTHLAVSINGDGDESNSSLLALTITTEQDKTQLFSAFAALSLPDQYDAVLTGLCAKLLDNNNKSLDGQALQDPMQLVQEMNEKNIPASPRSIMALIDVRIFRGESAVLAFTDSDSF